MKFGFEVTVENTYSVEVDVKEFLDYYQPELKSYLRGKDVDESLLSTDDMEFGEFLSHIIKERGIDAIFGMTKRTFIERNVEVW